MNLRDKERSRFGFTHWLIGEVGSRGFRDGLCAGSFGGSNRRSKTWDDAVSRLECNEINKNAVGPFSVKGLIRINGEEHHNPIINVPKYTAKLEEKKCGQRSGARDDVGG